jgi:hypothetical protein
MYNCNKNEVIVSNLIGSKEAKFEGSSEPILDKIEYF